MTRNKSLTTKRAVVALARELTPDCEVEIKHEATVSLTNSGSGPGATKSARRGTRGGKGKRRAKKNNAQRQNHGQRRKPKKRQTQSSHSQVVSTPTPRLQQAWSPSPSYVADSDWDVGLEDTHTVYQAVTVRDESGPNVGGLILIGLGSGVVLCGVGFGLLQLFKWF